MQAGRLLEVLLRAVVLVVVAGLAEGPAAAVFVVDLAVAPALAWVAEWVAA
jgi:hypothetical protein